MRSAKGMVLGLLMLAGVAFGADEKVEKERDASSFYFLNQEKLTTQSRLADEDVIIAFDPGSAEFVWKDFGANAASNEWFVIGKDVLDPLFFDMKTVDDVKIVDEHLGTYYKVRKMTETDAEGNQKLVVGLDLNFRMNGGGPVLAVICGAACKVIATAGCGAGAWIVAFLNPAVGIVYGATCAVLADMGATVSCMTVCLATPTP